MAPRRDKLKQTMAEDRKRLLLRARKWPFATWMMAGIVAIFLFVGGSGGDLGHAIGLGLVGGAIAFLFKSTFARLENRISAWLYDKASFISIVEDSDVKDKSAPNALVDEFKLEYCGGHLNWRVDKAQFGTLQVYERSLVFKNLKNRLRMPLARVNRVTLETVVQVRVKRLNDVVLPNGTVSKNKTIASLTAGIRKYQRYVVLDYTDDSGTSKYLVFWPRGGNSHYAKQVKEGLDAVVKKGQKDRSARLAEGAGALSAAGIDAPVDLKRTIAGTQLRSTIAGALPSVSLEAIAAAQKASKAAAGASPSESAPAPQATEAAKLCAFCKFSLKDPISTCSACGAQLHEGCWKANFGCTTKDCKGKPVGSGGPAGPGPTRTAEGGVAVATEIKYQVVLASAGQDDEEKQAVAAQLATIFNLPVEKCLEVVQRVPAVARRNISKADADKLAARLIEAGALAKVQKMPDS